MSSTSLRLLAAAVFCLSSLLVGVSSQCLSAQVTCANSPSVQVPIPFYNLSFNTQPSTATAWTYVATDTTDTCTYQHKGAALFNGTGNSGVTGLSYVDINAAVGTPNSAGVAPIAGNFGGAGAGSYAASTQGWSFEVTVKSTGVPTNWAKVFCLGNGAGNYDVLLGYNGGNYELDFTVDYTASGAATNEVVVPNPSLQLNRWYHVVVVVEGVDTTGNVASPANYFVYVDGQLIPQGAQQFNTIIPSVARQFAYLGRSCYAADSIFTGMIDQFAIYQHALTQQQVQTLFYAQQGGCPVSYVASPTITNVFPNQVPTSSAAAPTPFYSLPTATDPRASAGGASVAAYGWRQYDQGDVACGLNAAHSGLISFAGDINYSPVDFGYNATVDVVGTAQFVNMSTATGANSVGTVLPTIGGPSAGSAASGTAGWTIEVTFKPLLQETWAKVFDIGSTRPFTAAGQGQCINDLLLTWYGGGSQMGLQLCDANTNSGGQLTITNAFIPGNWYHVTWVMQSIDSGSTARNQSNYYVYVNGQLTNTFAVTYYPQAVVRQNAVLALSGWGDDLWAGLVDTFNVYNVALSQSQVTSLYSTAVASTTVLACTTPYTSATIPASALFYQANFTTDPRLLPSVGSYPTYGWLAVDSADSQADQARHTGLLVLNGTNPVNGFVNLAQTSGPNSISTTAMGLFGGIGTGAISDRTLGWTIEVTFKPFKQGHYAKLYDLGNGGGGGGFWDLLFGYTGDNAYYDVEVEYGNTEWILDHATPAVTYNTWYHHVWVIQYDVANSTAYQADMANFYSYTNGQLTAFYSAAAPGAGNPNFPIYVQRNSLFLGRSGWNDSAWTGELDTFRMYSMALNTAQVGSLYAAATGSAVSTSTGGSSPAQSSSTGSAAASCTTAQVTCANSPGAQVPTPFYTTSFDTQPAAATAWTYVATDTSDTCSYQHKGVASFNGTGQSGTNGLSYVDINAAVGTPNSAGVAPIAGNFGGAGAGSYAASTQGWSFEVTVKSTGVPTNWAKVFCLGNGAGNYDVLLGYNGGNYELDFTVDYTASGAATNEVVVPNPSLQLNRWYHVVVVVEGVDTTGNVASPANYFVYVDGQLIPQGAQQFNTIIPSVARQFAYLGRSCYAADSIFTGMIDQFAIYQHALTQQQVQTLFYAQQGGCPVSYVASPTITNVFPNQVPTSSAAAPTPFYSLPTATDPRASAGGASVAAYGWRQYDQGDVACGLNAAHSGLLSFAGDINYNPVVFGYNASIDVVGTAQFVNLSASTGPNSVGTVLPTIGGPSAGSAASGTAGWSFEVTFKPTLQETWAKVFDLGSTRPFTAAGQGQCINDLLFTWYSTGSQMGVQLCDANTNTGGQLTIAAAFTPGNWYHMVWVLQSTGTGSTAQNQSNYYVYVNGQLTNTFAVTYYPQAVVRQNAVLALSGWGDDLWAGLVDTFNVYNVALSQSQVASLFSTSSGGLTAVACTTPYTSSVIPSTALFYAATFDSDPRLLPSVGSYPTYGWMLTDSSDSTDDQNKHQGLLLLNGTNPVNGFVNLAQTSGPNSISTTAMGLFGGIGTGAVSDVTLGWTIEVTFKPFKQANYAKLYDLGNGVGSGGFWDLLFGYTGGNNYYDVEVEYGNTQWILDHSGPNDVAYNTWYHHVWVIQYDLGNSTAYHSDMANYITYVNGVQTAFYSAATPGAGNPNFPIYVQRNDLFLGRSGWNDSAWTGELDTFRMYSMALNPAQVASLYAASQTSKGGAGATSSTGAAVPPSGAGVSSSSTAAGAPSSPPTSSSSSGLSGGAIAGIVIGSVVGAAILCILLFLVLSAGGRRSKKATGDETSNRTGSNYGQFERQQAQDESVNTGSHHTEGDVELA